MTALTENPVLLEPHKHLTTDERDVLRGIGFYKKNRARRDHWQVGPRRTSYSTINRLKELGLIKAHIKTGATLTLAGELALKQLERTGK